MCPFIETIRIENGVIDNINYHNERLNRTRASFWKVTEWLDLSDYIRPPSGKGIIKCRVVYEDTIRNISYDPYLMREVKTLRIVVSDTIDYAHKSSRREVLNDLFACRGEADEVLIVKNSLLTDTSIANIALYDGHSWHTPAHPLLRGTRRAELLDRGVIIEENIHLSRLYDYSAIALFNAMIDFGKIVIPVNRQNIVL